jgi:hypothetical protein
MAHVRLLIVHPDVSFAVKLSARIRSAGWEVCGICSTVDQAAKLAPDFRPTAALVALPALPARDPDALTTLIELGVIPVVLGCEVAAEDTPVDSIDLLARLIDLRSTRH